MLTIVVASLALLLARLHPPQQPGVGNFILSVTGGVPVTAAGAA